VLSYDGKYTYMRSQRFDDDGIRHEIEVPNLKVDTKGEGPHLFSPTGFLDDIWWHRSYWVYGRVWKSGAGGYFQAGRVNPAGRPMVFDDTTVYGYGRMPQYYRWTTPLEYQLFASAKLPENIGLGGKPLPTPQEMRKRRAELRKKGRKIGVGAKPTGQIAFKWTAESPVLVRAMVLTDGKLFMAGPEATLNEVQTLNAYDLDKTQQALAHQAKVLAGAEGSILRVVSTDGKTLGQQKLNVLPVFDGMAAANNALYMATADGRVVRMTGK